MADFLEAGGIKTGQRNREAGPDFLLELGQHRFDGDDQDPASPAAFDQFGEQDAAFNGFAEADCIGDEEALAGLGERKEGWVELIWENVHGPAVAEVEDVVLRGGGADLGLQHEAGFRIVWAGIADCFGIAGIDDGDFSGFALDGVNETSLLALDQWGQSDDSQDGGPGGRPVDAPDEPLLVTDRDTSTRGVDVLLQAQE